MLKNFEAMLKNVLILPCVKNAETFLVCFNHSIVFIEWNNQSKLASASLKCFFRVLMKKK